MSDEGMDPCECFWSHELAMRRLLSLERIKCGFNHFIHIFLCIFYSFGSLKLTALIMNAYKSDPNGNPPPTATN
ncbi:Protein of unknown function [Gryllus bimaculatus]|nr:Protein of unknown function [Gryllus bimaculatus]